MSGEVLETETFTRSKESNFTVCSVVFSDQGNCTLNNDGKIFPVEVMKAYGDWRYKSMRFLTLVLDGGRFTPGEGTLRSPLNRELAGWAPVPV